MVDLSWTGRVTHRRGLTPPSTARSGSAGGRRVSWRAVGLIAGLIACWAGPTIAEARHSPADRVLAPLVESGQLSGVVSLTAVAGRPATVSTIGYADIATRTPMKRDTIFRAFSMTKPITGVALMILREQGKWDFNDPVAKFLPELAHLKVFRGMDAAGKPILTEPASQPTMGQLVSHTSGFLYGFGDTYVDKLYEKSIPLVNKTMTREAYLAALAKIPLAYDPGTQWQYSIGMDLEGLIIERLSGMTLGNFMRRHIFAPLRMKDTGFLLSPGQQRRMATLYAFEDGKLVPASGPLNLDYSAKAPFDSGGGGLFTTVDDYGRFALMLLDKGTFEGARILSPSSVEAMMTSRIGPAVAAGGYGGGQQHIRPGYEFGVNGVVVTDPDRAEVALGKGTYLWDGAAGTWFWVDPEHRIVFVGLIQRVGRPSPLPVQPLTQQAIKDAFFP